MSTITELDKRATFLNSKLTNFEKSMRMMSKSTIKLDEILENGKREGDKKGLGFDNKKKLSPKDKPQEQRSSNMSQHLAQHKVQKSKHMPQYPTKQKDQKVEHMSHESAKQKNQKSDNMS
ncbi:gag-pol polyprotein, partial [Trifolium medium]|nr:gag-pol polyprotein [Trifolium medium]